MQNRAFRGKTRKIDSAATSREEIGNPVHPGTVGKLQKESIPVIPHRAVQMKASDYEEYDYLIGMDSTNLRNMRRIVGDNIDFNLLTGFTFDVH